MSAPAQEENFEGQVLALLPSLRRYSSSLTRSDSDGEDLLQDWVEKVIERRSQWRGVNLRAWGARRRADIDHQEWLRLSRC